MVLVSSQIFANVPQLHKVSVHLTHSSWQLRWSLLDPLRWNVFTSPSLDLAAVLLAGCWPVLMRRRLLASNARNVPASELYCKR